MKIIIFALLLVFQVAGLYAQPTLYGVTQDGNGSIIKYDVAADSVSADYRFPSKGNFPGPMIRGQNGLLYGSTYRGGGYGYGVLFSFDPASGTYSVLTNFNKSQGSGQKSKLTQAPNGILFGVAQGTDEADRGHIFSYNPQSKSFKVFHRFTPFENYARLGTMVVGADGNLYGTTEQTIFQINPMTSEYKTVFTEPDFEINFAMSLTAGSNGLLYGTSIRVGANTGSIFNFNTATSILTNLYQLDPATGFPYFGSKGLTEKNGRLYGSNHLGIYSFSIGQLTVARHVTFDPNVTINLTDQLVSGLDGLLYSTGIVTRQQNNLTIWQGIVYRFHPSINTGVIVKTFPDNSRLSDGMLQLPNGKWYSTFSSNARLLGTIVSLDNAFAKTDLYRFRQNPGAIPSGALIEIGDGILYGATREGGAYDKGVLYSYNVKTKAYVVLKSFTGSDGQSPSGALCRGKDGKLYGVTLLGGSKGYGTLFSFDIPTSTYKLIRSFDVGTGGIPGHGLISDANGVLYGLTKTIDVNSGPTLSYLYSYNPANNSFTLLSSNLFQEGQPTFSKDGKIYVQSNGSGLVFKYDPVTKSKQEYPMPSSVDIGYETYGGLHQASNGLFYGMTSAGTTNRGGTLFSFNPVNGVFKLLFAFSMSDGNGFSPRSTLITGSDGLLYGSTYEGGTHNMGTLFAFDTKLNQLKKLEDFDESVGGRASAGSLFELNLPPFIYINDAKVYESDGQAVLTISLTKPSIYNIVVQYQMKSGTAISWGTNPDYIGTKRKLIFSAGMLKANITVPILKDQVAEPQEWFNVLLTNLTPTKAAIGDSISIVTINDGSRPSTVYSQSAAIEEGGKPTEQLTAGILSLRALPNPTRSSFSFDISTMGNKPAQLRIYDQVGRTIEIRSGLRSGRLTGIGNTLLPGIYYAELKQGSETQVIKLIKE